MEDRIRLGVNIPLFTIGVIATALGCFIGITGIWGYAAKGLIIPEWIKVSHGHVNWWGVLITIAAVLLPGLALTGWFRLATYIIALVAPFLWALGFYLTYARGVQGAMYIMPVAEIPLLIVLFVIALVASGIRIPYVTTTEVKPSKFDVLTDVTVPRRMFLVPALVAFLSVLVGFYIASIRAAHKPVDPAALIQLHTHGVIIAASAIIMLLALRVLNVREDVFNIAIRISQIAVPLTFLGLLVFIVAGVHSIIWVIPAGIYYILPLMVFFTAIGLIPRSKAPELPFTPTMRVSMGFSLLILLVLIATGAYIALKWDTSPEYTVTFRQEAWPHVGLYYNPENGYPGTAPVRNTPRGLENAHYSPGSWYHLALMWLIAIMLMSQKVFIEMLGKPGLIYLFAVTIPIAPFFNALGRYLAWWPDLGPAAPALQVTEPLFKAAPGGIGALWFAGHPLKAFNIISLFILGLVVLYMIYTRKTVEKGT